MNLLDMGRELGFYFDFTSSCARMGARLSSTFRLQGVV